MYLSLDLEIFCDPFCSSRALPGLKKKLVLLEEFNTELAKLKTSAEAEAMQLDEQLMRSRMENKKLQDWNERILLFEMVPERVPERVPQRVPEDPMETSTLEK